MSEIEITNKHFLIELSWKEINSDWIKDFFIFLDIDGTVAVDGGNEVESLILQKVKELNSRNKIIFCSNKGKCEKRNQNISAQTGVLCLNIKHKKPSRKILNFVNNPNRDKFLVIGDKFLIDGLFAWRIGAKFVKIKRIKSNQDNIPTKLIYLIDDIFFAIYKFFVL